MGIDSEVKHVYSEVIKNCPDDIRTKFHSIISRKNLHKDIDDLGLTGLNQTERGYFEGTILEDKIPYINVAHCLDNSTIISTNKDIESKYNLHPDKLLLVGVESKDICSFYDEIKQQ